MNRETYNPFADNQHPEEVETLVHQGQKKVEITRSEVIDIVLLSLLLLAQLPFVAYIITFYLSAPPSHWQMGGDTLVATIFHGIHMTGGVIFTILGPLQMMHRLRKSSPVAHRWMGRIYMVAILATSIAGEVFLFVDRIHKVPIAVTVGFAIAGAATFAFAVVAWVYARQKKFKLHREWAIRLFSLGLSSWCLRVWMMLVGMIFKTNPYGELSFSIMSWWFWLVNIVVAEIYIRVSASEKIDWSEKKYYLTTSLITGLLIIVVLLMWIMKIIGV